MRVNSYLKTAPSHLKLKSSEANLILVNYNTDDHEFNWKDGSLIGSNDGADWADEVVKKLLEVKPSTNAQILNNKKRRIYCSYIQCFKFY